MSTCSKNWCLKLRKMMIAFRCRRDFDDDCVQIKKVINKLVPVEFITVKLRVFCRYKRWMFLWINIKDSSNDKKRNGFFLLIITNLPPYENCCDSMILTCMTCWVEVYRILLIGTCCWFKKWLKRCSWIDWCFMKSEGVSGLGGICGWLLKATVPFGLSRLLVHQLIHQ